MGHKHDAAQILDGALAIAHDEGLGRLTFGRVAKHLGINDRTVVYYFPSKADLVAATLTAVAERLQVTLADAFSEPAADHLELVRTAWPMLADPAADPVFRLFFEAVGLGAAGRQPFADLVPVLIDAWVEWLSGLLDGDEATRRSEAFATIAIVDGLLLLRQLSGPEVADRAAQRLGVAEGSARRRMLGGDPVGDGQHPGADRL